MESQSKQFCSRCGNYRPMEDFSSSKQGKQFKLCSRHSKKRALPDLDTWDSFLFEIRTWSQPGQTARLKLSYTFDLDQLPINFGQTLEPLNESILDHSPMHQAIDQLVGFIREAGGHRFRQLRSSKSYTTYSYCCCQDSTQSCKSKAKGQRDRSTMERFPCNSKLVLQPQLSDRRLKVTLEHDYHSIYSDIRIPPMALEFIECRSLGQTPAEIYRDLQASEIPNVDKIAQYQVYYKWQQSNMGIWRRAHDQFISTSIFLSELEKEYWHEVYTSGNIRALAIYIRGTISALVSSTKELVIDAKFGTNSSGMVLTAVLAELDGTGIPLCYLFSGVSKNSQVSEPEDSSSTTLVLEKFLQPLKAVGFNPIFFGCDKDRAEISAIKQVWPNTTVQLCYWHAKRAIRRKLSDPRKTATQRHYFPHEAKALVPALEICWGSYSTRRSDGDHRYGHCQCPSSSDVLVEFGRVETNGITERNIVLAMFSRHFNMHSMIPDQNGTYRSAEMINSDCINELYTWCRARNYFRLWAYLFVNWYAPAQWKLWTRSSNPGKLPVLKTTMIIESHWRRIKHDFLHRFNRPRIDLVSWVLVSRVVPQVLNQMSAIVQNSSSSYKPAWRKAFKRQWKDLQSCKVDPQSLNRYHTDPSKWTCACEAYLLSRFLICKHIVHCFENISDKLKFFSEVRRQRYSPFWVHEKLVPYSQYRTSATTICAAGEISCSSDTELGALALDDGEDEECEENGELEDEDELNDSDDESSKTDTRNIMSAVESLQDILREQKEMGNTKFLEEFMASNVPNGTLLREIQERKRRRTMSKTWSSYKHSATMYYR